MVNALDVQFINSSVSPTQPFNVGGMAPDGAQAAWNSDLFAGLQDHLNGLDLSGAMGQLMQNIQSLVQSFTNGDMNFGNIMDQIANNTGPSASVPTI